MNPDFIEFLASLLKANARFLVVGAHALAVYGKPRATGDMDIWIDRDSSNTQRVWDALLDFGAPLSSLGVSLDDFQKQDMIIQVGLPPRRIDILTDVSGVGFDEAWEGRFVHTMHGLDIPFLGKAEFLKNKKASGRLKDLADIEILEELDG